MKKSSVVLSLISLELITAQFWVIWQPLPRKNHQQDERFGTLGANWNNGNTPNSSNHTSSGTRLNSTSDCESPNPAALLQCEFLIFVWYLPEQGHSVPTTHAVCTTEQVVTHRAHGFLWILRSTKMGSVGWKNGQVTVYNHNMGMEIKERQHRKWGGSGKHCLPTDHTEMPFWSDRPWTELQPGVVTTPWADSQD